MNLPLKKVLVSSVGVAGLLLGFSTPAHAFDQVWVHGIGERTYFAPGPPPGPALSYCQVKTTLYKHPYPDKDGVLLLLNPSSDPSITVCTWGAAQAVAVVQQPSGAWTLWTSNWNEVNTYNSGLASTGKQSPAGYALLGGNFKFQNIFGYVQSWQGTVW